MRQKPQIFCICQLIRKYEKSESIRPQCLTKSWRKISSKIRRAHSAPPVIIGLTDKIRRWGGEGGDWPVVTTTTSSLKGKYRQPFHNKRSNGDKILDQLKYQQKLYSLELQRSRSLVLNPLVDLVLMTTVEEPSSNYSWSHIVQNLFQTSEIISSQCNFHPQSGACYFQGWYLYFQLYLLLDFANKQTMCVLFFHQKCQNIVFDKQLKSN